MRPIISKLLPAPDRNWSKVLASSWLPLILTIIFLPLANGDHSVALASWLAPLFLLRFVRTQRPIIGLPLAYVVLTGAFAVQFRGAVPLTGVAYACVMGLEGLVPLISYAIDRFVAPKLSGVAATFVFPFAWVVVEYLFSFSPYGTWGAVAYSQAGNLPLMQLLSVTGLWGITFLIAWLAVMLPR